MRTKSKSLFKSFVNFLVVVLIGALLLGCMPACAGDETVTLVSIEASGNYKSQYREGETFSPSKLVVVANYSDGTKSEPLTSRDYKYDKTPLKAGQTTIEISYTEGDITVSYNLPITVISVPMDDGDDVKAYRFEAETATSITGYGGTSYRDTYEYAATPNVYKFSTEFSGNICMFNLFDMSYEFTFNSDKDARIYLTVRHANSRGKNSPAAGMSLSKYLNIVCNGDPAEEIAPIAGPGDELYDTLHVSTVHTNKYFDFIDTKLIVEIAEGTNTIKISPTKSPLNIDYIELSTSANITGYETSAVQNIEDSIALISAPTNTAKGRIAFIDVNPEQKYSTVYYDLPVLSETDYDKVGDDYFLNVAGKNIRLTANSAPSHTVTIDSNDVVFVDGTKTAEVKEGMALPSVICRDNSKTVTAWTEGGDTRNALGYAMPDHDVTLTPVLGTPKNIISGSGALGLGITPITNYINQGVNRHMGYDMPRDITIVSDFTVNGSSGLQKSTTAQFRTDDDGEKYTMFQLQGNVSNLDGDGNLFTGCSAEMGRIFRFATYYYSLTGVQYQLTYTVKNFGGDDIKFDIVIQDATDPYGFRFQHSEMVLKAGESIDLSYIWNSAESPDVIWTYITILEDLPNGTNLGVKGKIVENYNTWASIFGEGTTV